MTTQQHSLLLSMSLPLSIVQGEAFFYRTPDCLSLLVGMLLYSSRIEHD